MGQKHYRAKVYRYNALVDGLKPMPSEANLITSGITYKVLAQDSTTAETLYADNGFGEGITSKTNPVTTTVFNADDEINFVCDPTDSTDDKYVDLVVVDTAGGYTAIVKNFSPNIRAIYIDETPGVMHHGMIWFEASDATETDTGIDFNYDTFIHDVIVQVVTVDSGETLDVGLLSTETSGDADGFRKLVSVATAGYPSDTAVITSGSNCDYWPVSTYGELLFTCITGTDTNVTTLGGKSPIGPHVITGANAKSLTYTGSSGSDTAAGYIHYWFEEGLS